MGKEQISAIMATLECLEMTAADVMDVVASARAELKQTFEKIEQRSECA